MHCQHHSKTIKLVKNLDALPNASQQSAENIENSEFYYDTSNSLKPTKDDPQCSMLGARTNTRSQAEGI